MTSGVDTGRVTHREEMHRGVAWKKPVRVATTAAGTLATSFEAGDTVDGVTLVAGDRILVKDQASGADNGIRVVLATGEPPRAFDFDDSAEALGAVVFVSEGTTNGNKTFVCTTNAPITLGTTALTFADFSADLSGHVAKADDRSVNIVVDGAGSAITTGIKAAFRMPQAGHWRANSVLAPKESGSIVFDVWRDTHANAPPTVADTITAAAKPTISAAQKSEDTTLTGWTTAFAAGDWIVVNVDSATTLTLAVLTLYYDWT